MKYYQNKTISCSEDQDTAARKRYGIFVILKLDNMKIKFILLEI